MTRISIQELGNDVATSKFAAILDDGTKIEASFIGSPNNHPDEYAFLIDGKLEVLPKDMMDDYHLQLLDAATQSDADAEIVNNMSDEDLAAELGVSQADDASDTEGDGDDADVIDDTIDEPETEDAGNNVDDVNKIAEAPADTAPVAATDNVYTPVIQPGIAPVTQDEDADLKSRVKSLEEDLAEQRKLISSPDTIYAFERIVEALHDSVLHESHKTMDMIRNVVTTMMKVHYENAAYVDESGKEIHGRIVLNGRTIQPEDVPHLSRSQFFDVMSRLMVDYHQMRTSHLRHSRNLGEANNVIKRKTDEVDKLQRQLKAREHEIENLRSNRQGLTAGEAQDLIDCVIDADRRAATLAERMSQYSEPQDAYVLWLRTSATEGVFLSFERETKSVSFHTSIATTPKPGSKMLMTKNELEGSLPMMFDWIERSLLSPAGRELGFKNPKEFTLVPMRVMYRNIKEIKLSLVDSKAKVEVAKQIGASPMPVKDMQVYLQAPTMRGLTIEKFRKRREETAPAPVMVEDADIKVLTATGKSVTIVDDTELVDDFGEAPVRKQVAKPVIAVPVVDEEAEAEAVDLLDEQLPEEDADAEVEAEAPTLVDTRKTITRLSNKLARLRSVGKPATVVQSSTTARSRNSDTVSRFAPAAKAPAKRKRR